MTKARTHLDGSTPITPTTNGVIIGKLPIETLETPGADKQVVFNDSGVLGTDFGFEYDKAANVLSVQKLSFGLAALAQGFPEVLSGDDWTSAVVRQGHTGTDAEARLVLRAGETGHAEFELIAEADGGATWSLVGGTLGGGYLAWDGNTIWHGGNDGAGSSLDADLLDGQEGSYYLNRANHTGTLAVNQGGTGATTLTGYVKGNGTSAMTASATIPNTDITGLGTAATQNTGTSGANVPLLNGANTWSAAQAFTTLDASGAATLSAVTNFFGPAGATSVIRLRATDNSILPNTSDTADSSALYLSGGGGNAQSRGASVFMYGNEHATNPGRMILYPGETGFLRAYTPNGNPALLVTNTTVVFNEGGADIDFNVEGDTDASLLFVDAGTDRLGVGTNSPTAKLDVNSNTIRLRTARTPASAAATGNAGDICWDSNYLYVCVATNTWKRATLASW